MSQTSAAGSGGSAAPGWYTDPHDPSGLRWWSGEGWTEHVSAGADAGAAAGAGAAAANDAGAQAAASGDSQSPLPSRRALRDPATEASEAAEAALRAQAAQQQAQAAQQAQLAQQAQAAQQAAQDQAGQLAAQQAAQQAAFAAQQQATTAPPVQQQSPPVPTLPVAPTSFLEQQGYAPVGSTPVASAPVDPNAWNQPVQAAQPQVAQPEAAQPQSAPVQPAQPNTWNQPLQPAQPSAPAGPNTWNQPLQSAQSAAPAQPPAPAQPNAWNQPVQQEQPGWGAPAGPSDDLDSLFGGPTPEAGSPDSRPGQWGLSPSGADGGSRRNPEAEAEVSGSSTFWGWLIAISPILAAGAVIYVLLSTKSGLTDWPFLAALAAPYLLVVLFAIADRAVLIQLGHSQPRSPAWALLTAPIYLITRAGETRAEDGSGTVLTLAWFISVLVAIGSIVGYGVLTGHALIAGLPT